MPYRTQEHYGEVSRWLSERDAGRFPSPEALPPNGVVALVDGQPAAVSFVYLTDANAAYVTFAVSNPALSPKVAVDALARSLIATAAIAEQFVGSGFVWFMTHHAKLHRLAMRRAGFSDGGTVHSAYRLVGDVDPSLLQEGTKR